MGDEYCDEEDEDKPYHIIYKDCYIVVQDFIDKIRETICKPKVGENMMVN